MTWKTIERIVPNGSIWVLKYDVYFYPDDSPHKGEFCTKDTPRAQKSTSCHGWYESEAEALKVQRHFPKPDQYRLERVYKRELL